MTYTWCSFLVSETSDNVILGQLPNRIIIGFIQNKAFNENRSLNPFKFENFGINSLSLLIDGVQVPPKIHATRFQNKKLYADAYHPLFSGTGIHFLNEGNKIAGEDYPNGFCLFGFDLTPKLSANKCNFWNLINVVEQSVKRRVS